MQFGAQACRLALATGLAGSAILLPAAQAGASSAPFTDKNANGFIGFCDHNGHPVTSGSITEAPFVWTAVSSSPAPDGYQTGKATLQAYQPRQGVPPGEWSGYQMTASSSFTNPQHPMAQATYADAPLVSFTGAYPPGWNGLVQLRLYYSAANAGIHSTPYPATVIKVSGNNWSVVSGGTLACNLGHATSAELQIDPQEVPSTAPSVQVNTHPAKAGSSSQSGSPTTAKTGSSGSQGAGNSSATSSGSTSQSGGGTNRSASAAGTGTSGSGLSTTGIIAIVLGALAVIGAATAGFIGLRRRRAGI